MTFIGLFLIACGTGGIKPCVAAFGGDQFHLPLQEKYLQQFFSIFYFTINFGGFVGMILIPIMRKAVTCFGDDTCYALGFGFPATLMIIALCKIKNHQINFIIQLIQFWFRKFNLIYQYHAVALFLFGRHLYRLKHPKENIMLSFFRCIFVSVQKNCIHFMYIFHLFLSKILNEVFVLKLSTLSKNRVKVMKMMKFQNTGWIMQEINFQQS